GNRLEIGDLQRRVGDRLAKQGTGLLVDRLYEVLGIVGIDELRRDAEPLQDVVKLGVRAAVQIAGRDDVVSGLSDVDDRVEDTTGARGHAQTAELGAPFKQGHALFQHV